MSDLIERLRLASGPESWGDFDLQRAEAADEIERLHALLALDIHSCHPGCTRSGCVNERLRAENAELRAEMQREHIDNAQTVEDAAAVVRENAELRKDAERWRFFLSTRPHQDVIVEALDAAMEGKK